MKTTKKIFFTFLLTFFMILITSKSQLYAYKGTINDQAAREILEKQYDFNSGERFEGTLDVEKKISNIFIQKKREDDEKKYKYHTMNESAEIFYRDTDNARVYCIQSFYGITGSGYGTHNMYKLSDYSVLGLTEEQIREIELIGYYGAGYKENGYDHTGDKWNAVTQIMIWRVEKPDWQHEFVDKSFTTILHPYDNEIAEIEKLVDEHYITPDFSNYKEKINIGETVTVKDENGVLSKYFEIDQENTSDNISVKKSGNNLIIEGLNQGVANIRLIKQSKKYNTPSILYVSKIVPPGRDYSSEGKGYEDEDIQDLMYIGNYFPIVVDLKIEVTGGKITIVKEDRETGKIPQGDSTLIGAVYEVYNENNILVDTLNIGDDLTATTKFLPLGTYKIKEKTNPLGYILSNDVYTVNITKELNNITISVYNDVIKGSVEILKKLEGTDYDAEINLAGSRFELTLDSDPSQVYSTNKSGEDGICRVDNIPYGTYTAREVEWPDESYPVEDFKVVITENGEPCDFTKIDPSKEMKIAVNKVLLDETVGKTDAKVSGAYFTVYTDENATEVYKDKDGNPVIIGPTDNTGYAISGTMRTGTYYLKETTFPEGINPDAKVPGEDVTFRDKIYVASYDNKNQGTDVVTVSIKRIINISNLGSIEVIKYNNNPNSTDEQPAEGAILALTLKSNKDCVYYATIDENGYAEFINEDLQKLGYEYTIPYGEYEITEIEESNPKEHTSFYFQPETVEIRKDTQKEYRVFSDEPVPAWPRIVKKDKDTGESVPLAGATFKIWDCQNDKFVEQMETPSGEYIDEFVTNESGYLYTPQELQPGKYVVYETNAPEGYYLADELRLPADDKDLGDAKVSGKEFTINKVTTGLLDDAIYPEGGIETGSLVIEVTMEDPPLKVDLYLSKKGEKLTNSTSTTVSYKVNDNGETTVEEKYTPVYEEVGLEGVGYRIYAAENIYKPNGDIRVAVGTKVADITTNEDGLAVAKDLYPGEYRIEEYKTPEGYLKDENIPNVVLENEDQYVKNATVKKELSDVRQKLGLTFEKVFENVKYAQAESSEPKALFGVYTKEIITNYKGEEVIPNNALMDLIWVDENGDVTSQIDLPEGTYYVKELYASYPYAISEKTVDFTLEYNDNSEQEFVVIEGEEFSNTPVLATLSLIKLSSTSFGEVTMVGDEIENESFESEAQQFLNEIKAMSIEQLREYLKEKNTKLVSDAKYSVYIDAGCTKPLYVYNEQEGKYVEAEFVTDGSGIITLEDIPLGEYYIKETVAPHGYELSEEVVHVTLTNENKDSIVYKILMDEPVVGTFITKTDIFTGEEVPNCVFEIRDEDDELLLKSVTDENGEATIPLDMFEDGKTYTYTEVEAPDIYDLNTEPHEFVAEFDDEGNWVTEKIEVNNRRKTREVIVRKLDAETGEPLKGCVFTIAMIDPETGEQKVNAKTGEPIYLVENVETDENGEYIIPEAPMGTYKFLEIKAPEGYELDEDLTGLVFTIDNNSPETIIFEVTNTGDIAVIAIASVAVICAVGIVFVIRRNRKQA